MSLPKKAKIVANWKMYKTVGEAKEFLEALLPHLSSFKSEVWIRLLHLQLFRAVLG